MHMCMDGFFGVQPQKSLPRRVYDNLKNMVSVNVADVPQLPAERSDSQVRFSGIVPVLNLEYKGTTQAWHQWSHWRFGMLTYAGNCENHEKYLQWAFEAAEALAKTVPWGGEHPVITIPDTVVSYDKRLPMAT